MNPIISVKLESGTYEVAKITAVQQKSLLTKVSTLTTLLIDKEGNGVNRTPLTLALLHMGEAAFDDISNLVLGQVAKVGSAERVTIDDFQDNIGEWAELVAGAVIGNLSSFFTWLAKESAKEKEQAKQDRK